MLSQRNPRLRRTYVVFNSFSSGVSDATKELSRAPEMSVREISSEPGMFLQQTESAITFEKLESLTNTHRWGQLNEQVNVVNSNVELIDFTAFPVSNFSDEVFAIHSNAIEFHWIHSILAFPNEVESILSKAMLPRFQIHFSSPEHSSHYIHKFNSGGLESRPSVFNQLIELNFEGGNSSLGLKAEVPLPRM